MRQYQIIYQTMIDEHKDVFNTFFKVHDAYSKNPVLHQEEFNRIGKEVQEVIHDYERRLCGKTENGQYGKFSSNLSERFWSLIRADFPKIDFIGVLR